MGGGVDSLQDTKSFEEIFAVFEKQPFVNALLKRLVQSLKKVPKNSCSTPVVKFFETYP